MSKGRSVDYKMDAVIQLTRAEPRSGSRKQALGKPGLTMHKLVLMRHGESQWNLENRFTGWTDVDLTETGREQARQAGELLKREGYEFDLAFSSVLKRAIRTLWIALDAMDAMHTPIGLNWRLKIGRAHV